MTQGGAGLSVGAILQYSLLAVPLAFAGLPLYIHAPDFYARDLGVNIGLIGLVLMGVRLLDAVQDPVIGYVCDRHAGRRFVIVLVGIVMLWMGMGAVFYGPPSPVPTILWFALGMILATTGFSIATINVITIGGFWREAPDERTRIAAWREALTLFGILVAVILPGVLGNLQPAREAYVSLFWIFTLVILGIFPVFARFMRRIPPGHAIGRSHKLSGFSFLPILFGPDRRFFLVCFLAHLAAALPGVTVMFFIRDYLGGDQLVGLFLVLYFVAGALFMPIWIRLARRWGREKAWFFSMILAIATFIWAFALQPGDLLPYGVICVLSGMALGADLALPPAILADRVSARRREGEATQYYALLALLPKLSLALASGAAFWLLETAGFAAGVPVGPGAAHTLLVLYTLLPCMIKAGAAFLLWRLPTTEDITNACHQNGGFHGTAGSS